MMIKPETIKCIAKSLFATGMRLFVVSGSSLGWVKNPETDRPATDLAVGRYIKQ
jgi:hypothetical protein